jgi:hypothetical protein
MYTGIDLSREEVESWLTFPLLYEEQLVKYITDDIKVHTAKSFADIMDGRNKTIKIEGVERISPAVYEQTLKIRELTQHKGPITCHLFWAQAGSPSFPMHTDPYIVILEIIDGTKKMLWESNGKIYPYILKKNCNTPFVIPSMARHMAVNEHESIMLSFSTEGFLQDRLQAHLEEVS